MRNKGFLSMKVRQIPDHDCQLPSEDGSANYRIYQGCFVTFRRKLWTWVTVSPSDPNSKKFLKSATQIHAEELRHLIRFPNTIHPFSVGRFTWEMIMLPVWLLLYIIIPIVVSTPYDEDETDEVLFIKMALDTVCWIDIVIWFFTGYYDEERQLVVLNLRKIAKRYVLSYFVFDIVSSLPIKYSIHNLGEDERYHFFVAISLIKAVRLPTVVRYMHTFSEVRFVVTDNPFLNSNF